MKSNSLFQLIHSLTKHEKGYFRKFSRIYSTEGDKNYIELFDFIEKMDTYDEKEVKAEFKGTSWIRHLPVLKKYLFAQILKSLELYQRASKKNEKAILAQVDILMDRGLYREASDMLGEGQQVAHKNENYFALMGSYDTERMLVYFLYAPSQHAERLSQIRVQQQQTNDIITSIREIKEVSDHILGIYNKYGVVRDEKIIAEIDALAAQKLIPELDRYQSVSYRHIILSSIVLYHTMCGRKDKMLTYTREHVHLINRHPTFFADKPVHTMSIRFNYLNCCIEASLFKEFTTGIKGLEAMSIGNSPAGEAHKFRLLFTLYLDYIIARKAYPQVFHYLRKFEKEFHAYRTVLKAREQADLASNVAYLLFLNGKLQGAADWINLCLDLESNDINDVTRINIRVLDIILHYELKNYRLLESKLLSAKRYLSSNKMFFKSEQAIIHYLRQLSKQMPKEKELIILRKFHDALRDIYDAHQTERLLIDDLNLFQWLESRIKRLE